MSRAGSVCAAVVLLVGAAFAVPAAAQYGSSSGQYFHSAGAAYMNTLSWNAMSRTPAMAKAMRDAEARANAKAGSHAAAGPAPAPTKAASPLARDLTITDFRPVPEERARVIDSMVAGVQVGTAREALRRRIEGFAALVEKQSFNRPNNLAEVTCLLVATSLVVANGQRPDQARTQELVRAVNGAYAQDANFKRLDDRQRSRMYYLFVATIGLTGGLGLSANPAEAEAGRTLARNTLKALGMAS